jgi:hypothetical protein
MAIKSSVMEIAGSKSATKSRYEIQAAWPEWTNRTDADLPLLLETTISTARTIEIASQVRLRKSSIDSSHCSRWVLASRAKIAANKIVNQSQHRLSTSYFSYICIASMPEPFTIRKLDSALRIEVFIQQKTGKVPVLSTDGRLADARFRCNNSFFAFHSLHPRCCGGGTLYEQGKKLSIFVRLRAEHGAGDGRVSSKSNAGRKCGACQPTESAGRRGGWKHGANKR